MTAPTTTIDPIMQWITQEKPTMPPYLIPTAASTPASTPDPNHDRERRRITVEKGIIGRFLNIPIKP